MRIDLGQHIYWHKQYLQDLGINITMERTCNPFHLKRRLNVFLSPYIFEGTIEESQVEEMKLVNEMRRMSL